MIDKSKGIWNSGTYRHYYDDGWKAIVDSVDPSVLAEIAGLPEHQSHLPPLTPEEVMEEERQANLAYLASTDWYAIRYADTGEPIPADIKAARQAARDAL